MSKRVVLFAATGALIAVGVAYAQFPILDMVADKVIQKYQQSTCEQLWEQRGKPKSQQEQELDPDAARRPPDARRVHQQDRGAGRQQDVRMRHDSMTVRPSAGVIRGAMLAALGMGLAASAAAQQPTPAARPAGSATAAGSGGAAGGRAAARAEGDRDPQGLERAAWPRPAR